MARAARTSVAIATSIVAIGVLALCVSAADAHNRTGIRVKVTIGPTCPVEGVPGCGDKPYDARVRVRDKRTSRVVDTVRSGGDGRVFVPLPAGRYELDPEQTADRPFPRADPVSCRVRSGHVRRVTIEYDTGIR